MWLTDRGYPHRLVKLDPRTGEQKDLHAARSEERHPRGDRRPDGMIWLPEHSGATAVHTRSGCSGSIRRPRSSSSMIPMDPDNVVRNPIKWMQSLALDSKDNIYVGWIMGGALSKCERATKKVTVFRVSDRAMPFPTAWSRTGTTTSGSRCGTAARSRSSTRINKQWTEFTPPTYPGHVRRLNVDSQNNIWCGIWAAGKRPGKLAKLDQTTGRITEYTVPRQNSQPYDVAADAEGNIWFADSPTPDARLHRQVQSARLRRSRSIRNRSSTADTPKIQVTRDGAIWYSPRGSRNAPGDQRAVSRHGQDHDARRVLRERPAGISVQGGTGESHRFPVASKASTCRWRESSTIPATRSISPFDPAARSSRVRAPASSLPIQRRGRERLCAS